MEFFYCSGNTENIYIDNGEYLELVGDNHLTNLDLSDCLALTELDCRCCGLTALDLSNNAMLTKLYCSTNMLTELDLSQNTMLVSLSIGDGYSYNTDGIVSEYENLITHIDLSNNTRLRYLSCTNVPLESLDLSYNDELSQISRL